MFQETTHWKLFLTDLTLKLMCSFSSNSKFSSQTFLKQISSSAGDAFRGYEQEQSQDTAPFSTSDVDNDGCIPFCTFDGKAVESCSMQHNNTGWWFNQCGQANLNGSPLDQDPSTQPHLRWDTWTKNGEPVSIKSVTMKIRRVEGSNLK